MCIQIRIVYGFGYKNFKKTGALKKQSNIHYQQTAHTLPNRWAKAPVRSAWNITIVSSRSQINTLSTSPSGPGELVCFLVRVRPRPTNISHCARLQWKMAHNTPSVTIISIFIEIIAALPLELSCLPNGGDGVFGMVGENWLSPKTGSDEMKYQDVIAVSRVAY